MKLKQRKNNKKNINELKSSIFEKINKSDRPQSQLNIKTQISRIRNEEGNDNK